MFEVHVKVTAPELVEAINNLYFIVHDRNAVQITAGNAEVPTGTPMQISEVTAQNPTPAPAAAAVPPVSEPVVPQTAAAPVTPAAPAVPTAPAAPAPVVPAPAVAPAPQNWAPQAPVQGATPSAGVTLDAIITAGASLVEKGLMNQVVAILNRYGVQAVNQLQPAQFDPFAAELRALGAQI